MTLSLTFHDITNYREKGIELVERINRDMKEMNKSVFIPQMPNVLQMTQTQYDDLMALNRLDNMFHTEEQMFVTNYNVMEVRVTNRTKLTFQETQGLDDKEFDKWERETDNG